MIGERNWPEENDQNRINNGACALRNTANVEIENVSDIIYEKLRIYKSGLTP